MTPQYRRPWPLWANRLIQDGLSDLVRAGPPSRPFEVLRGTDVSPTQLGRRTSCCEQPGAGSALDKQFDSKGGRTCDGPPDRGLGRVGGML